MPGNRYGQRVIVVRNIDAHSIYEIGTGTYVGEEIPNEHCAGLGSFYRETGRTCPTVRLDSGELVYGCEFLFYPAEELDDLTSRTRVQVDLVETRAKQRLGAPKQIYTKLQLRTTTAYCR